MISQHPLKVLKALAVRDAGCRKTFADETGLSPTGVGNTLDSLTRYGYAQRVRVIEHPRLGYPVTLFSATRAGYDVAAAN